MRLKPSLTILAIVCALASCNSEQSGFAGARKADNATGANKNKKDNSEDEENPKKKGSKDGSDDDEDMDLEVDDDDDDSDNDEDDVDTDSDTDLENGEDVDVDDAKIVAKIPGVKVIRVGVNFEDLGFNAKSDNDYNDAVLCFEGNFKVEKTDVVSIKKQTVTGTTFSSSGCNHKVRVEITHSDGSKEPNVEFDSRAGTPVSMEFKTGSKLEVFMTPYKGCNEGITRNMHEPQHALVKPDVCKNSGG